MIKKYFSRTFAVIAAAAAVSSCGMAVSAESNVPELPLEEPAAQVMSVDYSVSPEIMDVDYDYDYDYNFGYDEYEVTEKSSKKKDWVKIILVALGVSIVVTGVTVYMIYRSYKYNGMTEPYEYKDKAPLELTEKEDQLVDVHVTKRHINKEN